MLRRAVKLSSFVMFPVLFGIAATADSIVMVLLGESWMPAVPLIRLCCLSYSVWHIHVANLQAINANGRSDIYLKLEIIKKLIGILVLILSIRTGIIGMIFMKAAFDYICTFINGWPNKKIIGYGPFDQWADILPEFLLSAGMFTIVTAVEFIYTGSYSFYGNAAALEGINCILLLCIQVVTGAAVYFAAALIFRMESLRYLIETIELLVKRKL